MGRHIIGVPGKALHHWPDERFDVVWVFDADGKGGYEFMQRPVKMLAGDSGKPIA